MSACLFTFSNKYLLNASSNELESIVKQQKNLSINYDKENRFECDRAAGYAQNVYNAELELIARSSGYSSEDLTSLLQREGLPKDIFAVRAMIGKFYSTKQPVKLIFDGRFRLE